MSARPAVTDPHAAEGAARRAVDLVLARTHLRLGSLGLARTELETLAGRGELDDEGIRDLAEARWRTGDAGGAGEAAGAWLEQHPDDVLGLVIAAESQAILGRPAEARRLAGRAMERASGSLDPVFAGMQRSPIWPTEAGGGDGANDVLFDDLHPGPTSLSRPANGSHAGTGGSDATAPPEPLEPGVPAVFGGGPSLWGDEADGRGGTADDTLDPAVLFHRGRVALEEGRTTDAATGLILALRSTPGLAPAVLDLLAGRGEPILVLVRGDAQRIVGHESEAIRDHSAAAGSIGDQAGDEGDDDRRGPARPPAADKPAADQPSSDTQPDHDQETP